LSHFRRRKLAFTAALSIAVTLHSRRVQARASHRSLVPARRLALRASPARRRTQLRAEALPAVTLAAQPDLLPAVSAQQQSEGLGGVHRGAEACRFLDDAIDTGDTTPGGASFSAALASKARGATRALRISRLGDR